jgi:heptosyltransferase III
MSSSPERILFISSSRVGDAVLTTSVLEWLRHAYPEAEVHIACGRVCTSLFEAVPGLASITPMIKTPVWGHWRRLWRWAVRYQWTAVVDMRGSAFAWTVMAGMRRSFHKNKAIRDLPKQQQFKAWLGVDTLPPPTLHLPDEVKAKAATLMPPEKKWLLLAPMASGIAKMWNPESLATTARMLTTKDGLLAGASIAVLGAAGDRPHIDALLPLLPEHSLDLCGKTDLLLAAACFRQSRIFIAMDSGMMHLAAAVGARGVVLFGPSNPAVYAPNVPYIKVVATKEPWHVLEAQDRGRSLLSSITPEMVIEGVLNIP